MSDEKVKREPAEYLIEVPGGDTDAMGWVDPPVAASDPLSKVHNSTAEAQRAIRKSGRAGRYRIVRVVWIGELKTESVTKAKLV